MRTLGKLLLAGAICLFSVVAYSDNRNIADLDGNGKVLFPLG